MTAALSPAGVRLTARLELLTKERSMETQADQVKECRMQLARMCEATDREVVAAALEFCEWAARLKTDDALKPTVTDF